MLYCLHSQCKLLICKGTAFLSNSLKENRGKLFSKGDDLVHSLPKYFLCSRLLAFRTRTAARDCWVRVHWRGWPALGKCPQRPMVPTARPTEAASLPSAHPVSGEGWPETCAPWWSPLSTQTINQIHRETICPGPALSVDPVLCFCLLLTFPPISLYPLSLCWGDGFGGREAGRERFFQASLSVYHISCF